MWRRVWRDKEGNAMIIGNCKPGLDLETWIGLGKLNGNVFFISRKNTDVEFEKKY